MRTLNRNVIEARILDISYRHRLSHLGSCLTSLTPLIDIFENMVLDRDKFVLSSGHAGLAYYVILEYLGYGNAEDMLAKAGIHPDRYLNEIGVPIHCSTGSLGQGLPIAVGMAIANPDIDVYCLISDGECAEGSIWEALKIASDLDIKNLSISVNINGFSAYSEIDRQGLVDRIGQFNGWVNIYNTDMSDYPFLEGIEGHYHVMNEEEYKFACEVLNAR